MQDATENCHYPKIVGESLKLEQNYAFPLEHISELNVYGKPLYSVAVDKFAVVGKQI